MKTESYTCDGCGSVWDLKHDPSAYVLTHDNLVGYGAIMGDNRIDKPWHLCKNCFEKVYKVIKGVSLQAEDSKYV